MKIIGYDSDSYNYEAVKRQLTHCVFCKKQFYIEKRKSDISKCRRCTEEQGEMTVREYLWHLLAKLVRADTKRKVKELLIKIGNASKLAKKLKI